MSTGRRITVPYAGQTYVGFVQADGTVRDLRVRFYVNHHTAGHKLVERGVARGGKVRRAVVPLIQQAARGVGQEEING